MDPRSIIFLNDNPETRLYDPVLKLANERPCHILQNHITTQCPLLQVRKSVIEIFSCVHLFTEEPKSTFVMIHVFQFEGVFVRLNEVNICDTHV